MDRIVSLLPSLTEITCALGLGPRLVGRSHECDYPSDVMQLPICTEPKFDVAGSSATVDRAVKELVRNGLSVYRVDEARLRQLAPSLILTQDQCEVCAVSLPEVEQAVREWTGAAVQVLSVRPSGLSDVWQDMQSIANACGVAERGRTLTENLTQRVTEIGERSARIGIRPSIACLEWLDPLMGAGNWMPELVALAGGTQLLGKPGAHSQWLEWDALCAADPDVILVIPCGFTMSRTRSELAVVTGRAGWSELRAVASRNVFLADGNQYFNRPGPRLLESLEILAEILHPEAFGFGHRGAGWLPLED